MMRTEQYRRHAAEEASRPMGTPSQSPTQPASLGLDHPPGADHYRAFVGPPADYDLVAAMTFSLLAVLGLRQQHRLLDIGCGSLRVGRLLLPYLNPGCYVGLEPNAWLVAEGIRLEVGQDQVEIKQPRFVFGADASELLADGARFDYAIAQSIFSHCGPDLLDTWLAQVAGLLADEGALLATFLEGPQDNAVGGWVYPDCVWYTKETMQKLAARHGLGFRMLDWRHPRQSWALFYKPGFDAVVSSEPPLSWNSAFDAFDARRQR